MALPSPWLVHDEVKEKMLKSQINFGTDAFVVRLYESTSDIDTLADNDASAATDELTTTAGYTAGGTATTCTVSQSASVLTVDFTNVSWNITGAGITCRFAAIIDTTLTPDEIVAHCTLDSAPADVSAADTEELQIQFHASGAFQLY
jgi:hypothetical protein